MKFPIARGLALALAGSLMLADAQAQYPAQGQYGTYPAQNPYSPYGNGPAAYAPSGGYSVPERGTSFAAGSSLQDGALPPAPPPPQFDQPAAQPMFADDPGKQPYQVVPPAGNGSVMYGADPAWGGGCGPVGCCGPGCFGGNCGNWFFYGGGLVMTRAGEDNVWLSYDTLIPTARILTSEMAAPGWAGGFETRFGRYFNCGCNAVEAVYWGFFPGRTEANAYNANGDPPDTILHFDELRYDDGINGPLPVSDYFYEAARHRLIRDYEVHNLELNLLGCCNSCCAPSLRVGWAAGLRYLRFAEYFEYATDPANGDFAGDPEELHYIINVTNQLLGCQIGGRVDYCMWDRLNLYVGSKLGLYTNFIDHFSHICGPNGNAWVDDPGGPWDGYTFPVASSKSDIAFLGELDLGLAYRLTRCWSLLGGYRAVAVTGAALAAEQIPGDYIAAIDSVARIDSNNSLVLHGAYFGVSCNF